MGTMKKASAATVALGILGVGLFIWNIPAAPRETVPSQPGPSAVVQEPPKARIFAAGDMMFDRQIRTNAEQFGDDYLLTCMDSLIKSADFAVANLEGPITASSSRSVGSAVGSMNNFYFTFPLTTGALLARHGIRAVDLGNNHILNFGYNGLATTKQILSDAGVAYFGGVRGDETISTTIIRDIPVAFLGYNEFGGSKPEEVAQQIAEQTLRGYRVIVYTHWGDEYIDSRERLRPIATLFAQAGAAAVIGSHPHVVLGHEYINDTLVYYSLGNFIFDQYFSEDVHHGLTLILAVPREGRVTAEEHPVTLHRGGQTCPTTVQ